MNGYIAQLRKTAIGAGIGIALGSAGLSGANAALPAGASLNIVAGQYTCLLGGTPPAPDGSTSNKCTYGITNVTTGSYFAMDLDSNGIFDPGNKIAIIPAASGSVPIGSIVTASGSHPGPLNGSETPAYDIWFFNGATGMHYLTAPITSADNGSSEDMDFSGWTVTWNGIPVIPMGGDTSNFPTDTGVATITCTPSPCANGSQYVVNYTSHVPVGDVSGFGGTYYGLYMVGTVTIPSAFASDSGTVVAGPTAVAAGSTDGRLTAADLVAQGIPADTGFTNAGGYFDFVAENITGPTVSVVIQLGGSIPANAVYRKFINGAWITFSPDAANLIASAASAEGQCPSPGDAAYNHTNQLVQGDDCFQITIEDNSPNFDNDIRIAFVGDPGGVAAPQQQAQDIDTSSGTSGCSISTMNIKPNKAADWWLLAAILGWLGWHRRKAKNR